MLFVLITNPSDIERVMEVYFSGGYTELFLFFPIMVIPGIIRFCHLSETYDQEEEILRQNAFENAWDDLEKCEISTPICAFNENGSLKKEVEYAMDAVNRDACLREYAKMYLRCIYLYFLLLGVSILVDLADFHLG